MDNVGGDGSVRDVDGMLTIESVGADLYVRNVHAAVTVKAGSDVVFYVSPIPGQIYDVTAGDDLILRLSPDANVKLHLTAPSHDSIQVNFPGVEIPPDCTSCEVILGEKKDGMAEMLLTASGDLVVTSQADLWESAADFDSGDWRIPPTTLPMAIARSRPSVSDIQPPRICKARGTIDDSVKNKPICGTDAPRSRM